MHTTNLLLWPLLQCVSQLKNIKAGRWQQVVSCDNSVALYKSLLRLALACASAEAFTVQDFNLL